MDDQHKKVDNSGTMREDLIGNTRPLSQPTDVPPQGVDEQAQADEGQQTYPFKYHPTDDRLTEVSNRFTYHAPKGSQAERYQHLRSTADMFAGQMLLCCPESRELSLALTHLQEAVMWANAAIACNE